jgi:hypothetical protein
MMQPQYVYRATNFIFDNSSKPKPKYFVVFHIDTESVLLLSLTTSQPKLPQDLDNESTEGCIHFNDNRGYGHAYIWKPNRTIGTNGFCFQLRTSVQFEYRSHLITLPQEQIKAKVTHTIEECCCLLDTEFAAILDCLIASKFLTGKQKQALQSRRNAINANF